ncbi:V-type ATP synthase subunit I [Salinispira pacifica]
MVEPMEKLTLLFRPADRDQFLSDLQKLGLVHVEQQQVEERPENARLAARIGNVAQHRLYLQKRAEELPGNRETTPYEGKIDDLIRTIDRLRSSIDGYQAESEQLKREYQAAQRWGDFDPQEIEELAEHGLHMTVHSSPPAIAEAVQKQLAQDQSRVYHPLFDDGGRRYFAVVGRETDQDQLDSVADEKLPERSVSVVAERMSEVERARADAQAELDSLIPYREELGRRLLELQDELTYRVVKGSVRDAGDGHLYLLTGWIPAAQREQLTHFLDREEAAYLFDSPKEEDRVPVKLRNDRFTSLFEPILRIFSIPNYRELDPTPFFAPFYTIFFGLCVADLGYGVLLLAGAVVALAVIKREAAKPLLYLGLILAASVMVFGLLLNDFFGIEITKMSGGKSGLARAVLFGNTNSAMLLAITLGIVQVTFGYVLRAVNAVRGKGAAGAMKPIGVVLMLLGIVVAVLHQLGPSFSVGPIPFGAAAALIPAAGMVGYVLTGIGLLLLLLFNSLEKKLYLRPLFGLWELYELITTVPGYILSYLRLFALGLSGYLLGDTVINLAMMVKGDSVWGIIPMVLVLLVGSGVNLAIGLLSAFVHSLRLTFVEFYNSVGFKGGGIEFQPFARKT